jgi:hypothetical protein
MSSTLHARQGLRAVPRHATSRAAYAALALTLGAAVFFELNRHGVGGGHALFFGLAPDLAFLYGIAPGLAKGQLHPRAVRLYNALHSLHGPVALATLAALNLFGLDVAWFIGALAWAAHITTDRALGYGPRTREGFQRA